MDKLNAPDVTAVLTSLWRQARLLLDDQPHVFEDNLGFGLANVPGSWRQPGSQPEVGLGHPGTQAGPWRASMVARARLVEDLVADRARDGVADSSSSGRPGHLRAEARPDGDALLVFEVDQPTTQRGQRTASAG